MNIFLILGNGFTIDFINHIKKTNEIDVCNLFRFGECVPWPSDERKGFFSYKHCPNLWNLGGRTYMDTKECLILIEDIITCANMLKDKNALPNVPQRIYLCAYKELAQYLKALFIYYDKKISYKTAKTKNNCQEWTWFKYISMMQKRSDIDKIHIITFNYDVWLERILTKFKIDFNISGFETKDCKIQIYKPHGSISFQSKTEMGKDTYKINYDFDIPNDGIDQFEIKYEDMSAFGSFNALIPPAGDSNRMAGCKWADTIRKSIDNALATVKEEDELILCGISYWHVDRSELDHYLCKIPMDISNVSVINPAPPRALNAVLTTYFNNVINYTDSKHLI